jgi:hypothetical protein
LLVACGLERRLTPGFFEQKEVVLEEVFLAKLIEGEHTSQPKLDVGRNDRFCPIDQEERILPSRLGVVGANRLENGLEVA